MKYMMLIYFQEGIVSEEKREECYDESVDLACRLQAKGQFLGSSPLHPTATATTVRVREGKKMVTDGPFAETREQLGGYYLVDAPNLDEAIDIAGQIPASRYGSVEIRPLIEIPGIPDGK